MISGRDVATTAAAAGVLGLVLGGSQPELQHAVESAQVLAGVVAYPPESPVYVYHLRVWTIVNQILALGLRAGLSERELSLAVSALLGMLSFQTLALCTLAFGRDRWLALAAPAWIFFLGLHDLGVCYPILLLGQPYTFGMLGTSFSLLALALLGLGRYRLALFGLGLAPAVHASLGSWALGVGVLSLGVFGWKAPGAPKRLALPLAAGLFVTVASLVAQLWLARDLPALAPSGSDVLLRAFVRHWDGHRFPIPPTHPVLVLSCLLVGVALLWLRLRRPKAELGPDAGALLRALALSAALGVGCALATGWLDRLPLAFVVAMPGRHLNLSSLAAAPLVLGLLARDRDSAGAALRLAALGLLGVLLVLPGAPEPGAPLLLQLGLVACALLAVLRAVRPREPGAAGRSAALRALGLALFAVPPLVRGHFDSIVLAFTLAAAGALAVALDPPTPSRRLRAAALGVLALATLGLAVRVERHFGPPTEWLTDWSNDAFLARVAAGRGVLASAGNLERVQIRTRRPVLLDGGALDGLVYTPRAAPRVAEILRTLYGEDLVSPSPEIRRARPGALLPWTGRSRFEGRSLEAWQRLARTHGFHEVLTPAPWRLRLPRVATDGVYALYRVPES